MQTRLTGFQGKRSYQLTIVGIILLAIVLRLYKLGEWSFWIEEAHSMRDITGFLNNGPTYLLRSLRPLFFVLTTPFVSLFGEIEWSSRLFSAFVGILTIPIAYVLTQRLYTRKTALLTSFLLAIAPWHVYWSQNVRFYALLLVFYTLALYSFYQLLETNDWRYRMGSILFVGLAAITHTIGAILIPIFIAFFLLVKYLPFEKPSGLKWSNLLIFIYLPLVGYVVFEIIRVIAQRPLMILDIYQKFFDERTVSFVGYSDPITMLTSVAYYVGVPLIIFASIGILSEGLRGKRVGLLIILGALFPLASFTILTPIASTANRYVFMSLFFWLLLSVSGMQFLYRRLQSRQYWPLIALILLTLIGLWRDPVRQDLAHYFATWQLLPLGLIVLAAAYTLGSTWVEKPRTSAAMLMTLSAVVMFAIVHSGLMIFMYFEYQHGHRDDWRGMIEFIKENETLSQSDTPIVAGLTPLARIYGYTDVHSIVDIDLNTMQLQHESFWFIWDGVVELVMSRELDEFLKTNCELMDNRDQFTAGREWPLRAYLCQQGEAAKNDG